jgi:hypothetical protein
LLRACAGEIVCTTPTVGANMEEVVFQNVHFEARGACRAALRAHERESRFLRLS